MVPVQSTQHVTPLPLPAELLIHIFELATHNPVRDIDVLVELPPFESINAGHHEQLCDAALRTKHAITTSCKAFRRLCSVYLYEDIRIRHGANHLADVLEQSVDEKGVGFGDLVKRVILSPTSSGVPSVYGDTRRIMCLCPNLQILYRPRDSINPDSEAPSHGDIPYCLDVDFPSLRRVDWLNCPVDALPVVSQFSPSFWSMPTLATLSIGADQWRSWHESSDTDDEVVSLRINTHTLRICSLDAFGPGSRLFIVDLPRLRRLILDKPESMYALFGIAQFGANITTLELGLHPEFARHDYLAVLIVYCQKATDLYYPIFTTQPTRGNSPQMSFQYTIKQVGLNAARLPPEMNAEVEIENEDGATWNKIYAHFESLCGEWTRFTALEKIVLYGDEWDEYLEDAQFEDCVKLIRSRDVALVREDDSVVIPSIRSKGN